jgi:DNA repair protein RecO (recombination protein O)
MAYFLRENAELANLSSCELMESPMSGETDYERSLALDYLTEVSEQLLPPHEPNEKFFRLLLAVVEHLREGGGLWPVIDYFSLWAVRLTGVLPELRVNQQTAALVEEMFATPVSGLAARPWTKATLKPLRRSLITAMEQHSERRLLTVPLLEAI